MKFKYTFFRHLKYFFIDNPRLDWNLAVVWRLQETLGEKSSLGSAMVGGDIIPLFFLL